MSTNIHPHPDDAQAVIESLVGQRFRLETERDALVAVVGAAVVVSDSNFRRLESSLRKSGWVEQADKVQAFRKVLEDYNQLNPQNGDG